MVKLYLDPTLYPFWTAFDLHQQIYGTPCFLYVYPGAAGDTPISVAGGRGMSSWHVDS